MYYEYKNRIHYIISLIAVQVYSQIIFIHGLALLTQLMKNDYHMHIYKLKLKTTLPIYVRRKRID